MNKSTQTAQFLAKAAHYPYIAQLPDLDSQSGDPDHPKNVNCSLYHCRAILKIALKFVHNLLSNCQVFD